MAAAVALRGRGARREAASATWVRPWQPRPAPAQALPCDSQCATCAKLARAAAPRSAAPTKHWRPRGDGDGVDSRRREDDSAASLMGCRCCSRCCVHGRGGEDDDACTTTSVAAGGGGGGGGESRLLEVAVALIKAKPASGSGHFGSEDEPPSISCVRRQRIDSPRHSSATPRPTRRAQELSMIFYQAQ